MKMYVVTYYYQEEPMLLGVFSTREKAEQLVNEKKENMRIDAEKYGLRNLKGLLNGYKIYEVNTDSNVELYI